MMEMDRRIKENAVIQGNEKANGFRGCLMIVDKVTVEGVKCDKDRVFSVQYHPESAPGPQDSAYLFDKFIRMLEEAKENA